MKYYRIPGTVNFKTSFDGRVFDSNNREVNTYINGDGYITASVKFETKGWRTLGVHRLIAMSQLELPLNYTELTVNHLDLDVKHNHQSNLEWATHQENNSHATVFRTDLNRPLILSTEPSGQHRYFDNVQHVSEVLGFEEGVVWQAIKKGATLLGWGFKHNRFDTARPKELQAARIENGNGVGTIPKRALIVMDTNTNACATYTSFLEAATDLTATQSHLHQSINRDGSTILKLFRKRYVVAYRDVGLPTYTANQLHRAKSRGKRSVIVYNVNRRCIEIYGSAVEFYTKYELSKKAVTTALSAEKLRNINGFIFTYLTAKNTDRLKSHIKRPGEMCA